MTYRTPLAVALAATLSYFTSALAAGQTPAGWKTVKDSTGVCSMSVPGNWAADRNTPGHMNAPGWGGATILAASKGVTVDPMGEGAQQAMGIGKMFDNSHERLFYAGKPTPAKGNSPSTLSYHVDVARKGVVCTAQIDVPASYPEDDVKTIAASISSGN
jgi:hypothetical protein